MSRSGIRLNPFMRFLSLKLGAAPTLYFKKGDKMIKKMLLVFLCLSLFLSIPCCKKKLPTQADIPILPTLEYFTANPTSIKLDDFSTLSWSVKNATNITIDHGVGTVSSTGTKEVSPSETTLYTLTATNSDGQNSTSCAVEIKKWAILEYALEPENPIFIYYPLLDTTHTDFTVVLTETNGVGGQINGIVIGAFPDVDTMCYATDFGGGTFSPLGTLSRYCSLIIPCKPTIIIGYIEGVDNNGYVIEEAVWYYLTWTANTAAARFLKVVKGASHHKLIK